MTIALLVIAFSISACGASGTPAPGSAAVSSGPPASGLASGLASSSAQPSDSSAPESTPPGSPSGSPAAPGSAGTGGSPGTVTIDPSLLAILPATVGGLTVEPAPDPGDLTDPDLVANVARMDQGFVVDSASGDFAYAAIVVLRPGVFSDDFFRSWRDSFDEGACSQAGGVAGHVQTTLYGRVTFVGRCEGQVATYHVRLEARDAILSISSAGTSYLGEQILAGLRP